MPVVKLTTSKKFERAEQEKLAAELIRTAAAELGKPEAVTQAIVSDDTVVSFGGDFSAPSAFIALMSIGGLNRDSCTRLSAAFCKLLAGYGIDPKRVYICFNDKKGEDFGWNSTIFG